MQDLRTENGTDDGVIWELRSKPITMRKQQPASGEIDMRFTTLTRMADNLMLYKYVIRKIHCPQTRITGGDVHAEASLRRQRLWNEWHQSLWNCNTNLFYSDRHYANLSDLARHYIGGLLKHAWALCGCFVHQNQIPTVGSAAPGL